MAIAVGSSNVVKVVEPVLSERTETVRNDGPGAVTLSKDPNVTAGTGFLLALNAEERIELEVGEGIYAICAPTVTASLEVI